MVDATIHCPACGGRVEDFQTKDDHAEQLRCEVVPLSAVNNIYTFCPHCRAWLDLSRPGEVPVDDNGAPVDCVAAFTITWRPGPHGLRRSWLARLINGIS